MHFGNNVVILSCLILKINRLWYHKIMLKKESVPKIIIYTVALLTTLIYITYRIFFTLPFGLGPVNVIFGLLVLFVEILEAAEFLIYYLNTLCLSKKSPKIPKIEDKKYPEVDVLIATINEDVDLIEGTIQACKDMEYPRKFDIYVCDDGNREEIASLCKKMKVKYINRHDNKGAKAGNYNNALTKTSAPYIATFDADMCPKKDFLLKTMPFFVKGYNVGFVQTPQSFKNPDIYQARLSSKIPFEQDYFYHYIQMARNNINSTILCGTNCVISRKALKEAGGFAEKSIAEDIATGMLIETKGYLGVAIDDVLAYGNSVTDVAGFIRQRSRWGRGCIQTFKQYGIFNHRILSFRQKLDYFAAITYWLFSVKRLVYLALPLLFAFFGIIIIRCDLAVFVTIFYIQYFVKRFAIDLLEGRSRSSTWNKIYELIVAPLLVGGVIKELFGFGNTKFDVTPKGKNKIKKSHAQAKLLFSHTLLLLLSIGGIVLAFYKANIVRSEIYIMPLVWLFINCGYLLIAILFDLRSGRVAKDFKPNGVKKYGIKSYFYILVRGKKKI